MRESDLERTITEYLKFALPPDAVSFHIPNEGRRGFRQQSEFKRAGGVAGMPDRCILWQGRAYFLEAKGRLGRMSPAQKAMFVCLQSAGCDVAVVRSVDDVQSALRAWGITLRACA